MSSALEDRERPVELVLQAEVARRRSRAWRCRPGASPPPPSGPPGPPRRCLATAGAPSGATPARSSSRAASRPTGSGDGAACRPLHPAHRRDEQRLLGAEAARPSAAALAADGLVEVGRRLQREQLGVAAAAGHELVVRSGLDDAARRRARRSGRRSARSRSGARSAARPGPAGGGRIASKSSCSAWASSDAVGSSSTRNGASRKKARASATRCHWPMERSAPSSYSRLSRVS